MIYFYDDIDATNSIRISNSEIAELDLVAKIKESDLDKYFKKYLKKDTNVWFYYDLSDLAEDYDCQYVQNDEFGLWYTDENIVESKKSTRKSIKESSDVKDSEIREWIDLAIKNFKSMIKERQKLMLKGCKEGYKYGKELLDDYIHDTHNLDYLISQIRKDVKKYDIDYNFYYYLSAYAVFSSNWNLWNKLTDELYESKTSVRKSIKESSDVAEKISSEIDKSYWIDKLIDDLDRHYESMEKAWLKNLDKLSDEDILGIVDDCMGKSKTLVGKSEMLKNKMIDDLSKACDDYIDDIDRQIRIGKSEEEIKDMIETTLENDIKMYLKLAYNNKASSNYFMVKFAEDNLI